MQTYRWVQIHKSDKVCSKGAVACVKRSFDRIFVTSLFDRVKDPIVRESVLLHEFWHICHNRLRKRDKNLYRLWELVSDFDESIVREVSKHMKREYSENAFCSWYAEKNYREDLAETLRVTWKREQKWRSEPYGDWRDIKKAFAWYIVKQMS